MSDVWAALRQLDEDEASLIVAPVPDEGGIPPTLSVHLVTHIYDLREPALCERAEGTRARSQGVGHWYTAARHRVTCQDCIEWMHA